jgi:hypothetical protein
MKLERADYLNFAKAGALVAAAMGLVLLILLRTPGMSQSVKDGIAIILFLPGLLVTALGWLAKGDNSGLGYFYFGGVLDWLLYTWCVWWFMERRRHKRSLRAQ